MNEENKHTEPIVGKEETPASVEEAEQEVLLSESMEAPREEEGAIDAPDGTEPPETSAVPEWCFSATHKEEVQPAHGKKHFFAVFVSVFVVCMALLVLILFVGDVGIKIYRTIETERTVYVREYDSESGLLTPSEAADVVKKSTVTISAVVGDGRSIASGFVYRADGYICTNHHAVEGATSVQVILPTGEAVDATIVGTDPLADVAVLKVDRTGLTPVTLGVSADLLVGEDVLAVGTPGKLDYAGTTTFGKISATDRIIPFTDDSGVVVKRVKLIQTDTSVNPGNSGGPLADMYGRVVGVVVMRFSYYNGSTYDGIGLAIPIDGVKIIADAIIATNGSFTGENPVAYGRCLLGVTGRGLTGGYWYSDLTAESVQRSETEQEGYTYIPYDGVYVTQVSGNNAVGKLQSGDIITRINGLYVYNIYDVINHVNRYDPYTTVSVTVMRPNGGEYVETTVEVMLELEQLSQ